MSEEFMPCEACGKNTISPWDGVCSVDDDGTEHIYCDDCFDAALETKYPDNRQGRRRRKRDQEKARKRSLKL